MTIIEALVRLRNDLKLWVTNNLRTKVDKEDGKGLSSNDFTNEEKEKLAALDPDATAIIIDTELSFTSENPVQNKVVNAAISSINTFIGDKKVSEQIDEAIAKIDYPVGSVNGKTGTVVLTASDVGALSNTIEIPSIDGLATEEYVIGAIADATYTLPTATSDTLGGIKVGSGLKINSDILAIDVVNNLVSTSTTQALSAAQGKALSDAINSITTDLGNLGGGDMLKATYDKNGDGIVDNSAQLEGHSASYFVTAEEFSELVGDTSVYDQICTEIGKIDYPVDSVNGKTGAVVLTASDVGALPNTTKIPSIEGLATETYVNTAVSNKVDKVDGKILSTNDYTTTEKTKLEGIAEGATKVLVDSELSSTSTNPVENKAVNAAISNLSTLVGDKKVSEQIADFAAQRSQVQIITWEDDD